MFRLLQIWGVVAALLATLPAFGQDHSPPPEVEKAPNADVDWTEIGRWGNRVVVSGEGPRAGEDVLFSAAMAPPPDESQMWFVTVWGKSDDPASVRLVEQFETDAHLTPFVAKPPNEKTAWAHFNFFKADDPTQAFRFKSFKIPLDGPFPAVMITPPRDEKFQLTIDGKKAPVCVDIIAAKDCDDPAKLQARIINSVRLYCKKLAEEPHSTSNFAQSGGHRASTGEIGQSETGAITDMPSDWNGKEPPMYRDFNPMWQPPAGPEPITPVETNLSYEQIKALVPTAPADWIEKQLLMKVKSEAEIRTAWMLYEAEQRKGFLSGLTFSGFFSGAGTFVGSLILGLLLLEKALRYVPGNQYEEQMKMIREMLERIRPITPAPASSLSGPGQSPAPLPIAAVAAAPLQTFQIPAGMMLVPESSGGRKKAAQ